MNEVNKMQLDRREKIALQLAPSLRDKFDFSTPEHYDRWADYAFVAADAFIKKCDALLMAAKAADDAASLAQKRENEMAQMNRKKPEPIGLQKPVAAESAKIEEDKE